MLNALEQRLPSALMAPTEDLAQQTTPPSALLEGMPVAGAPPCRQHEAGERRSNLSACAWARLLIIVGTHALLEDRVQFHKLGLVVIDEQTLRGGAAGTPVAKGLRGSSAMGW
jgi:ATP-dependent DNA helicase RecG